MSKKKKQDVKFTIKILLLGEAAVGKTALIHRFVHSKFTRDYVLTIGMEPYMKFDKIGKTTIGYSLWDIAGSQQFNRLRKLFFRGSKGAIVTFDLTRKDSFDAVDNWISDAEKESPGQKFILVGNKNDLKDKVVSEKAGIAKAKKFNCIKYIETSALTGDHVNDAFKKLGRAILKTERKKK